MPECGFQIEIGGERRLVGLAGAQDHPARGIHDPTALIATAGRPGTFYRHGGRHATPYALAAFGTCDHPLVSGLPSRAPAPTSGGREGVPSRSKRGLFTS